MFLLKVKIKVASPVGPSGWKEAGNVLLQKKEVAAAVEAYTAGIQLGPDDALLAVLLSNRSAAYLMMGEATLALMDADEALRLDSSFRKSLFRRGKALFDLERFAEAEEAFRGCEGQEKLVDLCKVHFAQVNRGEYDWKQLLSDCTRDSEHVFDVSDFRHRALELREIPGKGRGLVATEDLSEGTLVLVEKAALISFPSVCMAKRKAPGELLMAQLQDLAKSPNAKARKVVSAVQNLSQGSEEKADLELDANRFIRNILSVNGFAWWDSCKANLSQRPTDHGFGVWLQASMLNHSCVPNALYGFLGNVLVIRLARNVGQGEEICIAYCSCHDSLEERTAKLQRRGFECKCELCTKQRSCLSDEFVAARNNVFGELKSGKMVHSSLYWHGMVKTESFRFPFFFLTNKKVKLADACDDFHVSAIVARVVAVMSADRAHDFRRMTSLLEEAIEIHLSEPLLVSSWQEEVNLCIHAMFAAIALQDKELAERWTPRLDAALARFFPRNLVESMSNFMIISYSENRVVFCFGFFLLIHFRTCESR